MKRIESSMLSRWLPIAVLVGIGLVGCDFNVKNPGRILEVDLNSPASVRTLVTGMSGDFSEEFDDVVFTISRLTDEMAGSGSYPTTARFRSGTFEREDANGHWAGMMRARWVAEDGIRRMQEEVVDDEGNPWEWQGTEYVARAYLLAGLANRVIGETFCNTTAAAADALGAGGGTEQPRSEAFQRALNLLAEAITHGTAADEDDFVTAAHGGRAQAYVGLGDWGNAVSEAAQVPTDFVFSAIYSDNSGREENVIHNETVGRPEISAYDTYSGSFDPNPDPRAPYFRCDLNPTACSAKGADGVTDFWQQRKYLNLGSDIPLVKGTEMRLIEAEALLRQNEVQDAMDAINEVRSHHGLTDLTAANADEAWVHLDHERYLELWLEGRRLFDMYRWDTPDNRNRLPLIQFLYGDITIANWPMDNTISKRTTCMPISFNECISNDNIRNSQVCTQTGITWP